MKTLYILKVEQYDIYGRNTKWVIEGKYSTLERAERNVEDIEKNDWYTGYWKIIEATMDQEMFRVVCKEIEHFVGEK